MSMAGSFSSGGMRLATSAAVSTFARGISSVRGRGQAVAAMRVSAAATVIPAASSPRSVARRKSAPLCRHRSRLATYPLVTGLICLSLSLLPEMSVWERTLHIVPVVVVSMVWVVIPPIQTRLFHLL